MSLRDTTKSTRAKRYVRYDAYHILRAAHGKSRLRIIEELQIARQCTNDEKTKTHRTFVCHTMKIIELAMLTLPGVRT